MKTEEKGSLEGWKQNRQEAWRNGNRETRLEEWKQNRQEA